MAIPTLVQVSVSGRPRDRQLLASDETVDLKADTAVTGGGHRRLRPEVGLPGAGQQRGAVRATWTDTPRNSFRYFYSVTAFDVNSFESGPSSLESPRITKSVTPVRPASNYQNEAHPGRASVVGRGTCDGQLTRRSDPRSRPPASSAGRSGRPTAWTWLGGVRRQVGQQVGRGTVVADSMTLDSHRTAGVGVRRRHADDLLRHGTTAPRPRSSLAVPMTQDWFNGERRRRRDVVLRAITADRGPGRAYGGDAAYDPGRADWMLDAGRATTTPAPAAAAASTRRRASRRGGLRLQRRALVRRPVADEQ